MLTPGMLFLCASCEQEVGRHGGHGGRWGKACCCTREEEEEKQKEPQAQTQEVYAGANEHRDLAAFL